MKNKLSDLNNYLFEQIELLTATDLSDEDMKKSIDRANAVNTIAETIVKNNELQFKALKMASDYGIINQEQVKVLLAPAKETKNEND